LNIAGVASLNGEYFPLTGFAGGSPAASHFLLYAQKKVTKEKGTRMLHPTGSLRFSVLRGLADSTSLC
jgi:hypothetical protein